MSNRNVQLKRPSPLAWVLMLPIRFYRRFISPMTPPSCRYYPVCSSYAMGALRHHGGFKGTALTVWRLLRCNPWSDGGIDKVPEVGRWKSPTDDIRIHARDIEACALRPGSSAA